MKSLCQLLIVATFSLIGSFVSAQDANNTPVAELVSPMYRTRIDVPAIPGYVTLKCDFHMHTVFSDGVVWPQSRVQEAWMDGLDVIAITDHIRKDPSKEVLPGDNNQSYAFARNRSQELDIMVIKAGEISKKMPPGHFNALFVQDVDSLNQEDPMAALAAAARQGAFIQWNHPGWKSQQPDTTRWWPEHQKIYERGWMHGIEVFNFAEWYPIALDWCLEKNLAVMCNSDLHGTTRLHYDLEKWPRPMTLVFSRDRSETAIKEALSAGRTVAWFGSHLAGKKEHLTALFQAAIRIMPAHYMDEKGNRFHHVINTCDLPWKIKEKSAAFKGEVWLPRAGSAVIKVNPAVEKMTLTVSNAHTSGKDVLQVLWPW